MRNDFFLTAFRLFLQRFSDSTHRGAVIYHIWQPYYLLNLKYPSTQRFLIAFFKYFGTSQLELETVELYQHKLKFV